MHARSLYLLMKDVEYLFSKYIDYAFKFGPVFSMLLSVRKIR